jgi:hypothetical protein
MWNIHVAKKMRVEEVALGIARFLMKSAPGNDPEDVIELEG